MKPNRMNQLSLTAAIGLIVFLLVNASPAQATQYYCLAAKDICNVERSGLTQTVGCMNTSERWTCNLTPGKGIKCTTASKEKNPPSSDWYRDVYLCNALCGVCATVWSQTQSGGSTY